MSGEIPLRIAATIAIIAFSLTLSVADEPLKPSAKTVGDISILIDQLGDDSYEKRREAEEKLFSIGEPALPHLRLVAAKSEDLEIKFRAQHLVDRIMVFALESRSLGIKFAYIEPGEFSMGSPDDEEGRSDDEPQHRVKITRPFMIAKREVTQDDYLSVMNTNPSWFAATGMGKDQVAEFETGNFPVDSVTWFDAIEFCNRLSEREGFGVYYDLTEVKRDGGSIVSATVRVVGGIGYRLPTEAEWEFACRAGTTTPHHFGKSTGGGNFKYRVSHYSGTTSQDLRRSTTVGSYKPNAWGLYDMHGNVAEWCWDWYSKSYYSDSPNEDPLGPESGVHRTVRGGSFLLKQSDCRSATRYWTVPEQPSYFTGFRVARNPSANMVPSEQAQQ